MTLRCCESVRGADEVIVVDDGSADDTAARVAPLARVIRFETNRGFAAAANAGVAAARSPIVLLLNSDAIAEPGALAAFAEAFARDPKLGVAGARLLDPDTTPQWSGGPVPTLPWMIAVVSGLGSLRRRRNGAPRVDWVSGAAMAFRREAWSPLETKYRFYCQDIDFCLAAREKGWNVRIVEEARVVHARGATVAANRALQYDPAKLWPDLLTFGRARYGRAWAVVARVALVLAAVARAVVNREARPGLRALLHSDT